ncbi:MAG: M23 family metallopeptidase, partial [Nevskia sp.]|nr:M23 family metallopeptidase [Nevskia sp.]
MKVLTRSSIASAGLVLAALQSLSVPMPAQAQAVPSTAVPSGYGRYCSLSYASGGWAFSHLTSSTSNPCGDMLATGPGGSIARAGLWSVSGTNNAMAVCNDGAFQVFYVGTGSAPATWAFNAAQGKSKCVITVAPKALPVFSKPYQLYTGSVATYNRWDFNYYDLPIKASDFGQSTNPNCPNSKVIDKNGKQACWINGHGGYDWVMPANNALKAVASGVVRKARFRDTTEFGGVCAQKSPQGEIYIEHSVGSGTYAERFLTYYAHAKAIDVVDGQTVTAGQVIGAVGDNGCSSEPHLHFSVQRLTNLTGFRSFTPTYPNSGWGISGIHGLIDPFGWNAPVNVDPWATRLIGQTKDGVKSPGAYSINLWKS